MNNRLTRQSDNQYPDPGVPNRRTMMTVKRYKSEYFILSVDQTWKECSILVITFRIFGLVSLISLLTHNAFLIETLNC